MQVSTSILTINQEAGATGSAAPGGYPFWSSLPPLLLGGLVLAVAAIYSHISWEVKAPIPPARAGLLSWSTNGHEVSLKSETAATAMTWSEPGYGVLRSTDGGHTWKRVLSDTGVIDTLLLGAKDSVLAGTSGYLVGPRMNFGIYRSQDSGEHWNRSDVPHRAPQADIRSLLALPDGTIIAAGESVFSSSDDGATWTKISNGSGGMAITALEKNSKGTLFAGTADGVLKSTDHGSTWRNAGLRGKAVLSLLNRADQLFAGTSQGLFKSKDGGMTWVTSGTGLPRKWIGALSGFSQGPLYASVSGSGVFRSGDGGQSWRNVLKLGGNTTTYALEATPKGEIFASAANCCPVNSVTLFRSVDNGATWSRLLDIKNDNTVGAIVINNRGEIFVSLTTIGE